MPAAGIMVHVRRLAHVRRQVRWTWLLPLAEFGFKTALINAADSIGVVELSMLADLSMVADMSVTIPCPPPDGPNITKQGGCLRDDL